MLRDLGSRDAVFIQAIREVRSGLVRLAGANESLASTVLMQGSGTFGIEAVLSSAIPENGRLLILINGAYGERMLRIAHIHHIPVTALRFPEDGPIDAALAVMELEAGSTSGQAYTHVAVVHCETTTGVINPLRPVTEAARRFGCVTIVDAMSSFGATPVDLIEDHIDFLISSSNKCIEGVPGFSYVVAQRSALQASRGHARTLSLDLIVQWDGLEGDGQFRFTPPVHAILAFRQALDELTAEGGPLARMRRYQRNAHITLAGMARMGFRTVLKPEHLSHIISSFFLPSHPRFDFGAFYSRLSQKGYVIYPGKLSQTPCFRIGHIGQLTEGEVKGLLLAIEETLVEFGIAVPLIEEGV